VVAVATSSRSGGPATATASGASTGSSPSEAPLPDFTFTGAGGSITGDIVSGGGVGPGSTPGVDVQFLSYRDPAQGFDGPQLYVQIVSDTNASDSQSVGYGEGSGAEEVSVQGRPGYLTVLGPVVLLGVPPSCDVEQGLILIGYQLSEPQVLLAADGLRPGADGTWTDTMPPDDLTLAASGTDTAPGERQRTINIGGTTPATVVVNDGDASTFEGVVRDRVSGAASVSSVVVAGQPGVLIEAADPSTDRTIVWQPTPDTVAELRASASEADIRAVAATFVIW
jgi:hypothetical protein